MPRLHCLLSATDLSGPARHAAARAARLAREHHARLALTHVISQGALQTLRHLLGQGTPRMEESLMHEAHQDCLQLGTEVGQPLGISAEILVRVGNPIDEISRAVDAQDASLLVLGNRGSGFLRELPLGSTAERLLRRLSRPVLVVKQTPHETYRRVLVPVDFSAHSVHALRLAHAVAPQADLILLHAFEVPYESQLRRADLSEDSILGYRSVARREASQQLDELAAASGVPENRIRRLVLHGNASENILVQEQEQDCDLIVMGKHGQSLLEEWLLGSVSKHVLSQSACDVLVTDRPRP